MTENTEHNRIEEFALGPGVLYMKRGRVSETEMEDYMNKAGDTDGGCRLVYEYKTRELYDVEGNMAENLRYGEKLRIKGKLCRVLPETVECLQSKDPAGITVLLVCPLPNGESFRLYMQGGASAGAVYDAKMNGTVEFELIYGNGVKHPKFCLAGEKFGEAA